MADKQTGKPRLHQAPVENPGNLRYVGKKKAPHSLTSDTPFSLTLRVLFFSFDLHDFFSDCSSLE